MKKRRYLKKGLAIFLTVALVVGLLPGMGVMKVSAAQGNVPTTVWTDYAADSFAGGNGTEAAPYQIATAGQLAKLSKDVREGTTYEGKFFKLADNIDLSGHRWVPIGIYKCELLGIDGETDEDITKTTNNSFQGFIYGNNKTITGLVVDERTDKNAAGFFGNILNMNGGTVGAKDLTISNANIYADEEGLSFLQAGILAGTAMGNKGKQVVFENITVSGAVEIESSRYYTYVGGMIGNGSWIKATNCKAENISVTGASNSGGFIGVDVGSVYENCEASGKVSGTWVLGGFVGNTATGTLGDSSTQSVYKKCAADVEIEGNDWNLGGFAGYAEYGKFDNCVAFGDVTSTLSDWEPHVGGFFGASGCAVANKCYAAGKVNFATSVYKSSGGFVGCYFGDTFTDCFFDIDKNSGLTAAGVDETDWESYILSDGVEAADTTTVKDKICADYYGGHDYSTEWTIDTAATCTTDGSKSQHCEHCDAKSNITVITAAGHDLTKIEAKAATCIEDGYNAYWACKNCEKLFSDEAGKTEIDAPVTTPKTGHTCDDEGTRVEPTCENKGSITYKCTKCGEVMKVVELAALGHTWDAGKVTTEPTETAEGVKTYTCSVCGKTKTEVIPKKEVTTQEPPATPESPATPEPPKKGDVIADDKGTGDYEVTNVAKKEVAYQTPADNNVTTISIPKTVTKDGVTYKVTSVADSAFANNKKITKVTIGSNITTISDKAFYKCTSLTKITIPSEVEKIGKQAFYGCKKLKTITIKTTKLTNKNVGSKAFKGIYEKATIKVPESKLKSYKKILKAKGVSSKAKIIK